MPSGKASRRGRQAVRVPPPPVHSKAGRPPARRASPRVLIGAAAVALAVVVAIVVAAVVSGGSSNSLSNVPAVGSLVNALPGAADVNALFRGIPQAGTTLGSTSAPVTLEEFIDPQCPYCREFETQVLPSLIARYVRTGRVKIEMQPWAFIGPDSVTGQAAELAAAQQNRIFNFAELLYFNQGVENTGWLNTSIIASTARSIPGLRVHTLLNARSSPGVKAAQQTVDNLANTLKVSGTPTLFVGKSGTQGAEVHMASATDEASVIAAINAAGA
jgi:protein-disulfide isomerase